MTTLHSTTNSPPGRIRRTASGPASTSPAGQPLARRASVGAGLGGVTGAAIVGIALAPAASSAWRAAVLVLLAGGTAALAAAVVTGPEPTTAPNRSERVLRALVAGVASMALLYAVADLLSDGSGLALRIGVVGLLLTSSLVLLARSSRTTPSFAGPTPTDGSPFPVMCRAFKRTLDLTLGSIALVVALPVIAASAIAIKLGSPGPWLFRQVRVGIGGRPFTVLKLRTMSADNDASEHRAYVSALIRGDAESTGPGMFKLTADPRVTSVGRFLRGPSLDELPQLFNVLQGTMSLVGPRPGLAEEVAEYDDDARMRLAAKPGMTGLWQVSGRSKLSFAEMIDLDVRYWKEWTPLLELRILARTPRVAFFAREDRVSDLGPIPLADLGAIHRPMLEDLRETFERVLASSAFTLGAEVERFEERLAERLGVRHAIGVGSGTAALQLALLAAGVGPGDEVILPPNTFFATVEAIIATGATPVLADVDPATALLDPAAVEAAITARTAAIAAVHLYGQPVNAERFRSIAERHGLFVLEDAAQAIGATWDGHEVGGLGDAAAFSFYPGKNLGALGDGGAVTTGDDDLARRVRLLRSHGEGTKHVHEIVGFCERLDGLQAAFLTAKLAHLDAGQQLRDAAADRYRRHLEAQAGVSLLATHPRARHVHHLLVVRVPERDRVLGELHRAEVYAGVHYPTPIHLQPATRGLGRRGQFPHSEVLASSILSLPLYPGITDTQVDRVVDTLRRALRQVA